MSPRLMPRAAQCCITPQVMVNIRRAVWGTVCMHVCMRIILVASLVLVMSRRKSAAWQVQTLIACCSRFVKKLRREVQMSICGTNIRLCLCCCQEIFFILFSTLIYSRTLLLLHVVLCHHVVLPYHARQNGLDVLDLAARLVFEACLTTLSYC